VTNVTALREVNVVGLMKAGKAKAFRRRPNGPVMFCDAGDWPKVQRAGVIELSASEVEQALVALVNDAKESG